jgi:hypothetical protein
VCPLHQRFQRLLSDGRAFLAAERSRAGHRVQLLCLLVAAPLALATFASVERFLAQPRAVAVVAALLVVAGGFLIGSLLATRTRRRFPTGQHEQYQLLIQQLNRHEGFPGVDFATMAEQPAEVPDTTFRRALTNALRGQNQGFAGLFAPAYLNGAVLWSTLALSVLTCVLIAVGGLEARVDTNTPLLALDPAPTLVALLAVWLAGFYASVLIALATALAPRPRFRSIKAQVDRLQGPQTAPRTGPAAVPTPVANRAAANGVSHNHPSPSGGASMGMGKVINRLLSKLGLLLVPAVVCLAVTGCASVAPVADERQSETEAAWQKHAGLASGQAKALKEAADRADDGEASLQVAVNAFIGTMVAGEADQRLKDRALEQLIDGGVDHLNKHLKDNTDPKKVGDSLGQLGQHVDDPKARAVVEALSEVARAGDAEEKKAAADKLIKASEDALKRGPGKELPAGDPELVKIVNRARELVEEIKQAGNDLQKRAKAFDEFVKVVGLGKTEMAKLVQKGQDFVDRVAGPALGLAQAVGDVASLAAHWDDMNALEKIGGVAGALGSVLSAVQPFMTAAAAQYKVPVMLALTVISKLLPNLNLADVRLPGPNLGGGGKGKGGEAKGGKGGKDGKGGNGKGQPAKGPSAKDRATATAVVHGSYKTGPGAAKDMAGSIGERLHLNKEQTRKLQDAFDGALKDAKASPQEKAQALADAALKADPEIARKIRQEGDKIDAHAQRVHQKLQKKPSADPNAVRDAAALLAANGNQALADMVRPMLQNVDASDLRLLAEQAARLAYSFDPQVVIPPKE